MNMNTEMQIQRERFDTQLNSLLANIRAKATGQFDYNLQQNVPRGILCADEIADHAIEHGVVSALSERNQWGIWPTMKLAADMLEDVNAHVEAAALRQMIDAA